MRLVAYLARVAHALLEYAWCIVGGHVPPATHHVVNVLAESFSPRAIFASAEAKFGRGHEVLNQRSIDTLLVLRTSLRDCIVLTVHSCICRISPPNAFENTSPPIGLPFPRTHMSFRE
jgi:hypothetical protein